MSLLVFDEPQVVVPKFKPVPRVCSGVNYIYHLKTYHHYGQWLCHFKYARETLQPASVNTQDIVQTAENQVIRLNTLGEDEFFAELSQHPDTWWYIESPKRWASKHRKGKWWWTCGIMSTEQDVKAAADWQWKENDYSRRNQE